MASNPVLEKVEQFATSTTKEITSLKKSLGEMQTTVKKIAETPNYGGNEPGRLFAQPRDAETEGKLGFNSLGEFANKVKMASPGGTGGREAEDFRTNICKSYESRHKTVSGMSEAVDSEGGFLVPPTFASKILERVYENDLLKRTDSSTVTGNTMVFNRINETSRVNGSRHGGVQAYWRDEAATVTATKPKIGQVTLKLKSLMALGYVTEELEQDGPAMGSFLQRHFGMEIDFKVGDAIYRGTGAGMPQGILNSPALVTVDKEAGQAAATINANNLWKMYARMWAPSLSNAVWFINQDVWPQLFGMVMPGATPAVPIYLPPGGIKDAPYGSIMGRPVVPLEFCSTLGTVGDIVFADMGQYLTISKGTMDTQMSVHLRFDYAENAYRAVFRVDGQGWWSAPLTPFKGSNTQSPFIALQTRS